MRFRIATFNLHGGHRRWEERRELIVQQLVDLPPDVLCLNEVLVLDDTGRWLWQRAQDAGLQYSYLQQNGPGYYWAADAFRLVAVRPRRRLGRSGTAGGGYPR